MRCPNVVNRHTNTENVDVGLAVQSSSRPGSVLPLNHAVLHLRPTAIVPLLVRFHFDYVDTRRRSF